MPVAPSKESLDPEVFDITLEPHVLTDKEATKLVPCGECRRACVVTTFMAPAKVKCNDCGGGQKISREAGSMAVVQAGRTPPEYAANLADCLINREFEHVACPFNPEHVMELKDVCHVPNYGPRQLLGYGSNGVPKYEQKVGELVTHQCTECNTVVQFSTTKPRQLRRVNEPKVSQRSEPDSFESILGAREAA